MTYSKESSSLVFKTSKTKNKLKLDVKISLNDECKNGHQDFSITATGYEKAGNYFVDSFSGCCHEEILEFFPEFKIFVDLHLCDFRGAPMHAASNMYYHIKKESKETFQKYYNFITDEVYSSLNKAEDLLYFRYLIEFNKLPDSWKKLADKAIFELECLTETKFINNSIKSNFKSLTEQENQLVVSRLIEGYYTDLAIQKRKQEETHKVIEQKLKAVDLKYNNELLILNKKHALDTLILQVFKDPENILNNIIYYSHVDTITFNWSDSRFNRVYSKDEFEFFKMHALQNRYLKNCLFEFKDRTKH